MVVEVQPEDEITGFTDELNAGRSSNTDTATDSSDSEIQDFLSL
jgi:hypothetical protein